MSTNSSQSQSQSIVDFIGVLTESKRIINAHSRHFLALSVLFLLPLSFSLSVFPTLFHTFTSPARNRIVSLLRFNLTPNSSSPIHLVHHHDPHHKTLVFSLIFSSFIISFFLLAFASVSSSVHHGFYGRPVKLGSAISSGFRAFFPLLFTFLGVIIVFSVILSVFGGFGYLGAGLIKGIEEGFWYNSFWFYGVVSIGVVLLALALGYVAVNWVLVYVIVVVESNWGIRAMIRSRNLVRGMRWVALSLIVVFGFFLFVLLWISMVSRGDSIVVEDDGWSSWAFAVRIVITSAVLTLLLLHGIAAITILYMYCKALHGELAGEIVHEFAADYVSLPFDDEKVPHVVCYVY